MSLFFHIPNPISGFYLGCAWGFRAIFQSTFEYWCSTQAARIKQELRSEITGSIDAYSNLPCLLNGQRYSWRKVFTGHVEVGVCFCDVWVGCWDSPVVFSYFWLTQLLPFPCVAWVPCFHVPLTPWRRRSRSFGRGTRFVCMQAEDL